MKHLFSLPPLGGGGRRCSRVAGVRFRPGGGGWGSGVSADGRCPRSGGSRRGQRQVTGLEPLSVALALQRSGTTALGRSASRGCRWNREGGGPRPLKRGSGSFWAPSRNSDLVSRERGTSLQGAASPSRCSRCVVTCSWEASREFSSVLPRGCDRGGPKGSGREGGGSLLT